MKFSEPQHEAHIRKMVESIIRRRGKQAALETYPEYEDFILGFYINPRNEQVKIDLSNAIEKIKPKG
jgi:hypothetical protein